MVKNLLSAALLASLAIGAQAYNVDDYIYTRDAKYKVTAANIVTNGTFNQGETGLDGWTATDAATAGLKDVFSVEDGVATVNSGMTAFADGMYQVIPVTVGGTYIVTMKIMGTAEGCTDIDMNAAGDNYINAYFNSDGALATVSGTALSFGTDGVCNENTFQYSADDFTEIAFVVTAASEGNVVIDLRGMTAGLQIKDVECHAASSVTDERVAQARLDWIKYILNGYEWTDEYEYYEDVLADVETLEGAIKENSADITTYLENLNGDFGMFAEVNLSNVLNTVNGGGTGNNSANWMNWTGKYNKLSSDYNGTSGWTWTTDRWCHKTAAADNPMQIQWMRGASGTWDNIATLSTTLDKGTYFYSVEGQGGMMTKNKNRWKRHSGYECAQTYLFFNNDTVDCGVLPTTQYKAYIKGYTIDEESALTLGIRCNQSLAVTNGFDVWFYNPVVYKVLEKGELTPEQKTYLSNVQTQIDAVQGRIDAAEQLVAENQTTQPWGKADLQKGIDATKERLEAWKAMNQDAILECMDNMEASANYKNALFYIDGAYTTVADTTYTYETLANVIMNAGVRYINNHFITIFNNLNAPLTDMPTAIAAAKTTKEQRIYSGSSKMADLTAEIAKAQALYDQMVVSEYSAENAQALVDEKAALAKMVEDFKNAISVQNFVDIDFNAPEGATKASFVKHEDPEGLTDTYYTLAGKKGEMKFSTISDEAAGGWTASTFLYELGYNQVDSLGMLRVGNTAATAAVSGVPANTSDIVRVSFDFGFGKFVTKEAGYYITSEQGDTICGFIYCAYGGTDPIINTFNVNTSKVAAVGSSSQSNAYIAQTSNITHFELILDYGKGTMYCTTSNSSKGTVTTDEIAFNTAKKIANFVLWGNYNNTDRRCWFDNLKVDNIATEPISYAAEDENEDGSVNVLDINTNISKIIDPTKGTNKSTVDAIIKAISTPKN